MSSFTEYESRHRNAATEAGRPKVRMRGPAIPLRDSTDIHSGTNLLFVWQTGDGKLVWSRGPDMASGRPAPLGDMVTIADALIAAGSMIAVPDTATARKLVRRAEIAGTDHAPTARRIRYSLRAATSSRIVVLTESLSRKYFLPADQDATAIGAWCRTFNLPGPDAQIAPSLLVLLNKVTSGESSSQLSQSALKALLASESEAFDSLYYSGARSAATAFRASSKIADAWTCIEKTDAILRSRYLSDGSVVVATPLRRKGPVECLLSTPVQLKQGDRVLVGNDSSAGFDADGRAKLVRLEITDEGMIGSFDAVKGKGAAFSLFDNALSNGQRLLVTAEPFLGMRSPRPAGTWFARDCASMTDVQLRDVPLDVALAGVPIGD